MESMSRSVLIKIPCNKLVLKKEYMIKRNMDGLIYTGTYYYMFSPDNIIDDMLGLGQPMFIDVNPTIKNDSRSRLICNSKDEFYELKVKID